MRFNGPVIPRGFIPDLGARRAGCPVTGTSRTCRVVEGPQARMEEERPSSLEVCPLFSLRTMALRMIRAQTTVLAHSVVCSFRGLSTLFQLL